MSQHDYDIANQTASATRSDLNLSLKALASQSSGATAPSTTYANMPWYDTATNLLKMRNEANDAWITLGTLDQSGNTFASPEDASKANLASPALTGNPTAPTQTVGNNSTRLATTAFVQAAAAPPSVKLGEITSTSASTVSLTGLDLTGYNFIYIASNTGDSTVATGQNIRVSGTNSSFVTVWINDSNSPYNYGYCTATISLDFGLAVSASTVGSGATVATNMTRARTRVDIKFPTLDASGTTWYVYAY